MDKIRYWGRFLALPLAVAVLWATLGTAPARAGLVPTEEVVSQGAAEADRERVAAFLARDDVREQLARYGIDPGEASARVASLSDSEVQRLAARLEERPAGGANAVGALIGAGLFVFFVLLITDIAGVTDVFTFVKK